MNASILGRYVPYDSFVHKMDPRAKIAALIFLMVAMFLGYTNYAMSFLMAGLSFVFFLILLLVSRTSILSLLSSMKSLWFMAIILLIIYCLVPRTTGTVAFYIGSLPIYLESILDAARILIRLFLLIELTMILTSTTKPLDLTYALEWYLKPFSYIGFPSAEVAMVIALALRFIPTVLEDVGRIMRSQQSRGVDFKRGKISTRLRALTSLIVPLFISAFVRSEELADAMTVRGYKAKGKRTRYRELKFNFFDFLKLFICAAYLAGCLYISISGFDLFALFGVSVI